MAVNIGTKFDDAKVVMTKRTAEAMAQYVLFAKWFKEDSVTANELWQWWNNNGDAWVAYYYINQGRCVKDIA